MKRDIGLESLEGVRTIKKGRRFKVEMPPDVKKTRGAFASLVPAYIRKRF